VQKKKSLWSKGLQGKKLKAGKITDNVHFSRKAKGYKKKEPMVQEEKKEPGQHKVTIVGRKGDTRKGKGWKQGSCNGRESELFLSGERDLKKGGPINQKPKKKNGKEGKNEVGDDKSRKRKRKKNL